MSIKISRVLHAGYLFETVPKIATAVSTKIIFDPIFENPFSQNCYAYPNIKFDLVQISVLKLDAIFISHYHDDHCSLESLHLLNRDIPIYMFCIFEDMFTMLRELGFKNVFSVVLGQKICIGELEVTARRALDADVDSIFHVHYSGINILNVIDSWIDDDTLDMLCKKCSWDMVLWPFQTMREIEVITPRNAIPSTGQIPEEHCTQLKKINPNFIVPSACQFIQEKGSWYRNFYFPISYANFKMQIENILPKSKVIRLNPGVSVLLSHLGAEFCENLPFINPVGPQDLDYVYQPHLKIPHMHEIAKNFRPVTSDEKKLVSIFCEKQMIEKYNSFETSDDEYFNKIKIWKLTLYDNQGSSTDYFFEIENQKMRRTNETVMNVSWLTEISESKLFSALFEGESLTTLYLRINDFDFLPEVSDAICNIDISEDPLIKTIYNGVFGAYQRIQLLNIKNNNKL